MRFDHEKLDASYAYVQEKISADRSVDQNNPTLSPISRPKEDHHNNRQRTRKMDLFADYLVENCEDETNINNNKTSTNANSQSKSCTSTSNQFLEESTTEQSSAINQKVSKLQNYFKDAIGKYNNITR